MRKMNRELFQDLKVADFAWMQSAPVTAALLADFGATVVRVEDRALPCSTRTLGPYKDGIPGIDRSGFFTIMNPNKYSITLNLDMPQDLEAAKKLIAWSDIVIQSFSTGTMERKWGLGYESLKKIKEDIIMVSPSIQGQTGIHSAFRGIGPNVNALTGLANLLGWPDRDITSMANPYSDWLQPCFTIGAIATALEYRRRTGKGQQIDSTQFENTAILFSLPLIDCFVNNRVLKRSGNRHPDAAPHGVYRCQGDDEWCTIAIFHDTEWKAFCKAIGNPLLTDRPNFATLSERKCHEDELDRLVEVWTINLSSQEVMERLQEAGVAAGQVKSNKGLYEDVHVASRQFFQPVEHPEVGTYQWFSWPFQLSKVSPEPGPAPRMGEHNSYICKEILGLYDEEFNKLSQTTLSK
ncbi:CaiB/BaiF CoA transferase family protein [Chloroflexota bacterium]